MCKVTLCLCSHWQQGYRSLSEGNRVVSGFKRSGIPDENLNIFGLTPFVEARRKIKSLSLIVRFAAYSSNVLTSSGALSDYLVWRKQGFAAGEEAVNDVSGGGGWGGASKMIWLLLFNSKKGWGIQGGTREAVLNIRMSLHGMQTVMKNSLLKPSRWFFHPGSYIWNFLCFRLKTLNPPISHIYVAGSCDKQCRHDQLEDSEDQTFLLTFLLIF